MLQTVKKIAESKGFIDGRTLALETWTEHGLQYPRHSHELKEQNARFQAHYQACLATLKKLHKQGVLEVSRKAYYVRFLGMQPTEYKLAEGKHSK